MADWHLSDLGNALTHAGWTIVEVVPGDDVRLAGSWQVQRTRLTPPLTIDFVGLDHGGRCLTMPEAYACSLREVPTHSLYFCRRGQLRRWREDLKSFVAGLNEAAPGTEAS